MAFPKLQPPTGLICQSCCWSLRLRGSLWIGLHLLQYNDHQNHWPDNCNHRNTVLGQGKDGAEIRHASASFNVQDIMIQSLSKASVCRVRKPTTLPGNSKVKSRIRNHYQPVAAVTSPLIHHLLVNSSQVCLLK